MAKYYAKEIIETGEVVTLHKFSSDAFPTNPYFVEITEEKYNTLLAEMTPTEPEPTDEISDSEALGIILGEA